jgi:four helix bundle protein
MHKNLDVWNMSMGFVTEIYKLTHTYPKEELFGLSSQIRRAAVSVPSNIAEGAARQSTKEFVQFLYVSLGSYAEIEIQLMMSKNLGYPYNANLYDNLQRIKQMLLGLIKKRKNES